MIGTVRIRCSIITKQRSRGSYTVHIHGHTFQQSLHFRTLKFVLQILEFTVLSNVFVSVQALLHQTTMAPFAFDFLHLVLQHRIAKTRMWIVHAQCSQTFVVPVILVNFLQSEMEKNPFIIISTGI